MSIPRINTPIARFGGFSFIEATEDDEVIEQRISPVTARLWAIRLGGFTGVTVDLVLPDYTRGWPIGGAKMVIYADFIANLSQVIRFKLHTGEYWDFTLFSGTSEGGNSMNPGDIATFKLWRWTPDNYGKPVPESINDPLWFGYKTALIPGGRDCFKVPA